MASRSSSIFIPSRESLGLAHDASRSNLLIQSSQNVPKIDDNFDLSQFDWLFRRSVTLGLQDFSNVYRNQLEQIGEGANFKVFKCMTQLSLEADAPEVPVALKRLKTEIYFDERRTTVHQQNLLKSLLREVYSMSILTRHPNILKVFGVGSDTMPFEDLTAPDIFAYQPFLVVEYANHGTLNEYLSIYKKTENNPYQTATNAVSIGDRLQLCLDIGHGLEAIHQKGFIHRDTKPDNVLISQDEDGRHVAKLADFGMTLFHATEIGEYANIQQYFAGTDQYAAPELSQRITSDLSFEEMRKGDIFSFGLTCLECLTSRRNQSFQLFSRSNIMASLEPKLQAESSSTKQHVEKLLCNTLCKVDTRWASLQPLFQEFDSIQGKVSDTAISDPRVQNQQTSWPMSDSVSPFVFNQADWRFLDGDEELIRTFGLATRLTSLLVSAPWTMQKSLYRSIQQSGRLRQPERGKLLFCQGLCPALGFGTNLDFSKALGLLFMAAEANYLPARCSYRRLYQAMCSINPNVLHMDVQPDTALGSIDPILNGQLAHLKDLYADEYLAYAMRLSEKRVWQIRCLRECPPSLTFFTDHVIDTVATDDTVVSLRLEIKSLLSEGWSAHRSDHSYPIDYLLALAIAFDDSDSKLFQEVAESFSNTLTGWDFHFSGLSAPISPLFLAARVGNHKSVRYLVERGARPGYKSYLGMIPLHFLFLLADEEIVDLAILLSAQLCETDEYFAENTCVSEHLCSLVGTPFAFSVQVNHKLSITTLQRTLGEDRCRYTLEYQGGPGVFLPGVSEPMQDWKGAGELFDQLSRLQSVCDTVSPVGTRLARLVERCQSVLNVTIMLLMVFRAWHMYSLSLWVMHGGLFQQRLEQCIAIITDSTRFPDDEECMTKVRLALQPALLVAASFRNENLLFVIGSRLKTLLGAAEFASHLARPLATQVRDLLYSSPHIETLIGLFPTQSPSREDIFADILLSYRCHDTKAFARTFSQAHTYSDVKVVEFALL